MKCMSQYLRIMSLKMRWPWIWATFGIQTMLTTSSNKNTVSNPQSQLSYCTHSKRLYHRNQLSQYFHYQRKRLPAVSLFVSLPMKNKESSKYCLENAKETNHVKNYHSLLKNNCLSLWLELYWCVWKFWAC